MWTTVAGVRVHARTWTSAGAAAAPVVCVHGLVVSSRYLRPVAEELAARRRVYAPDLPGFGLSGRPPAALGVGGLADALADWMEAAGVGRASLLGNSLGCQIALDLAVRRPELVAALVLNGPSGEPGRRSVVALCRRALLEAPAQLDLIPTWLADLQAAGVRRAFATLRATVADRPEEKLGRVQAPALVVRGARDRIVSQAWAEEVARRLPRGRLVVLPASGHPSNWDAPAALARAAERFLAAAVG